MKTDATIKRQSKVANEGLSNAVANGAVCRVEAVVSVDERGQMVLPKDLRTKAGIQPGEKFALISWERDGKLCCFTLARTEVFDEAVKETLAPIMKDIF